MRTSDQLRAHFGASPWTSANVHGGTSGTGGIRTPGPLRASRFQGECICPLCHRSVHQVSDRGRAAHRRLLAHVSACRVCAGGWFRPFRSSCSWPRLRGSQERCQSGRMGCPAKALTLRGPWVQIPPSPPSAEPGERASHAARLVPRPVLQRARCVQRLEQSVVAGGNRRE